MKAHFKTLLDDAKEWSYTVQIVEIPEDKVELFLPPTLGISGFRPVNHEVVIWKDDGEGTREKVTTIACCTAKHALEIAYKISAGEISV